MSDLSASHHESNRAFYDRISEAYDLLADASERSARLVGLEALDLKPGEHVLEIGFGTGNEILDLADKVGAGGRVCGVDISPGMLKVALRKLERKPSAGPVDLQVADARRLPFEDNAFDAAYCSFTLELFLDEDLPQVLAETCRVLRSQGRLAVVSMSKVQPGERASFLEEAYLWMHRHFPHIVDCRPIDVVGTLKAAGLEVLKAVPLEIWTMPVVAAVARKNSSS
jgi:ubiquinone/menaquinone biosynthesis C-methylase UbiE